MFSGNTRSVRGISGRHRSLCSVTILTVSRVSVVDTEVYVQWQYSVSGVSVVYTEVFVQSLYSVSGVSVYSMSNDNTQCLGSVVDIWKSMQLSRL